MNRDYRLTAQTHNITIDAEAEDDLTFFPTEKARFRSIWYSMGATVAATTGYGWALQYCSVSSNWLFTTLWRRQFMLLNYLSTAHGYSPHPAICNGVRNSNDF